MTSFSLNFCFAALFLSAPVPAASSGFLSNTGARLDVASLELELAEAMGVVMGCGGSVTEHDLTALEEELAPIWLALPKLAEDRVDRRSLRYLVHRFFDRRSALHIRGFEPTRPVNASGWGNADILSQRVPAFVESVLESSHKLVDGFSMRDAALVAATIQKLVFDSESVALAKAYRARGRSPTTSLSQPELALVMEAYMLRWMLGDDDESVAFLEQDQSELTASIPHWNRITSMAYGKIKALDYRRKHDPKGAFDGGYSRQGHNALVPRYSFDDAHRVVGEITESFASFWDSECQSMKASLVDMDVHGTGRVPLSKFYGSSVDGEWRFGESEAYLRELGALDETHWRGKQVIIPNYIQGASNCIVSTSHYLLCCVNECEALLGDLEVAVGGPVAEPSQLLALARGMTPQSTLDDDVPVDMSASLIEQLENIATVHDGIIPLHGRLFAQWLHFAFPRECPFPHQVGNVVVKTPAEFGESYLAEFTDMQQHAAAANGTDFHVGADREEMQWMSQWSPEEELVSEEVIQRLRSPWKRSRAVLGAVLFAVALFFGHLRSKQKAPGVGADTLPTVFEKAHFV